MSEIDNLRYDHHREHSSSPLFPGSAYYTNPENMYDIATPRGRELLNEVYPSSRGKSGNVSKSPVLLLCIAAFILFVLFS